MVLENGINHLRKIFENFFSFGQFWVTLGEYILQFLKDNRALICNGRVTPVFNDFTFLSTRGRSVPDYIYCPADHIQYCKELKVIKVSEIIDHYKLPVPSSMPDHYKQ